MNNTFLTGMLTSQEVGATDGETVYNYWLKLRVHDAVDFELFDIEHLSTTLRVGQQYEMVLLVESPEDLSTSPTAPSNVQMNVIGRIVRLTMNEARAIPEKIQEHLSPIRALLVDPAWRPTPDSYLATAPDFYDRSYVLLETAFGRLLMEASVLQESTPNPLQPGAYLEWKSCRLDVQAVAAPPEALRSEVKIRHSPEIITYAEEITHRMMGLPLLDILKQGVATWNAWRAAVRVKPAFAQVDLSAQDLSGVDLREANLQEATLNQANLSQARLGGARLARANLSLANLSGVTLERADLTGSDLSGARLQASSLRHTSLLFANLTDADLTGADLSNASLWETNLRNTNLSYANLSGADLSEAILDGATISNATYTEEQLSQARSSKNLVR